MIPSVFLVLDRTTLCLVERFINTQCSDKLLYASDYYSIRDLSDFDDGCVFSGIITHTRSGEICNAILSNHVLKSNALAVWIYAREARIPIRCRGMHGQGFLEIVHYLESIRADPAYHGEMSRGLPEFVNIAVDAVVYFYLVNVDPRYRSYDGIVTKCDGHFMITPADESHIGIIMRKAAQQGDMVTIRRCCDVVRPTPEIVVRYGLHSDLIRYITDNSEFELELVDIELIMQCFVHDRLDMVKIILDRVDIGSSKSFLTLIMDRLSKSPNIVKYIKSRIAIDSVLTSKKEAPKSLID